MSSKVQRSICAAFALGRYGIHPVKIVDGYAVPTSKARICEGDLVATTVSGKCRRAAPVHTIGIGTFSGIRNGIVLVDWV